MEKFFETLEKVRQKPASGRRMIAVLVSVSATLLIGLVWFVFNDYERGEVDNRASATNSDIVIKGPFESILNDIEELGNLWKRAEKLEIK